MGLTLVDTAALPVRGLRKGQLIAIAGRRGDRIESRRGAIWVTQDDDPNDIVLDVGEAHVLERDAPALIQALDAACVAVTPSADGAPTVASAWRRLRSSVGRALAFSA